MQKSNSVAAFNASDIEKVNSLARDIMSLAKLESPNEVKVKQGELERDMIMLFRENPLLFDLLLGEIIYTYRKERFFLLSSFLSN